MPTTDTNAVFGNLITRRDVELAIVSFLRTWVPTYVAEVERQAGLPPATIPMPPDPDLSYRGGLDFETWEQGWSPVYIVNAQPVEEPQRVSGEGIFIQQFDVQVACNFVMSNDAESLGAIEEDSARQYADLLGFAGFAAILQHGGLGNWPDGTTVSVKTVPSQYPRATFPYTDERRVVRSQFGVQALVANFATEANGPSQPIVNPYASPGDWPVSGTPAVTLNAVPLSQQVPASSTAP